MDHQDLDFSSSSLPSPGPVYSLGPSGDSSLQLLCGFPGGRKDFLPVDQPAETRQGRERGWKEHGWGGDSVLDDCVPHFSAACLTRNLRGTQGTIVGSSRKINAALLGGYVEPCVCKFWGESEHSTNPLHTSPVALGKSLVTS